MILPKELTLANSGATPGSTASWVGSSRPYCAPLLPGGQLGAAPGADDTLGGGGR